MHIKPESASNPGWIVVAGGGSGIGRSIALKCLEMGWKTLVADLDTSWWSSRHNDDLDLFSLDVLSTYSLKALAEYIHSTGVPVSGIACTIGKAITKPLQSMKAIEYSELFDLNTISFFGLVKALTSRSLTHPDGMSIVVVSSLVGDQGAKGKIAYSTTKGALNAAVRSMAMELVPRSIRVNAVSPGTVRTEMLERLIVSIGADEVTRLEQEFPLGLGFPEDVADLAVYLLSGSARWITGAILTVDGGFGAR